MVTRSGQAKVGFLHIEGWLPPFKPEKNPKNNRVKRRIFCFLPDLPEKNFLLNVREERIPVLL